MTSLEKTLEDLAYTTKKVYAYLPAPAARAYLNLIRFAEINLIKAGCDIDIETNEVINQPEVPICPKCGKVVNELEGNHIC